MSRIAAYNAELISLRHTIKRHQHAYRQLLNIERSILNKIAALREEEKIK